MTEIIPVCSLGERSIVKISSSLLTTIPKAWCEMQNLAKGQKVEYLLANNGLLLLKPVEREG